MRDDNAPSVLVDRLRREARAIPLMAAGPDRDEQVAIVRHLTDVFLRALNDTYPLPAKPKRTAAAAR